MPDTVSDSISTATAAITTVPVLIESPVLPPTYRQFAAFQQAYCYFNRTLFQDSLQPCILILSGRSKTGYFVPNRWVDDNEQKVHEIGLNPLLLDTTELQDVMAVLVHNMVHQWQWEQGHQVDRTKPFTGYHNKEWAMKMASLGLAPSDTGEADGKATGFVMSQYVVEGGDFSDAFAAMPPDTLLPYKARKIPLMSTGKSPKLAYQCIHPNCEKKVWGAPNIQIRCACGEGDYEFLPDLREL